MTEGHWNFYFEAPKGSRILRRGFFGISMFEGDLWWSHQHKKWLPLGECGVEGASSTAPCRSFKAFKSHLRRHPELQTGVRVHLSSRFVGYDVSAIWSKELRSRPVGRFVTSTLSGKSMRMIVVDEYGYLPQMVGSAGL